MEERKGYISQKVTGFNLKVTRMSMTSCREIETSKDRSHEDRQQSNPEPESNRK